jgi:hypothetical protein
VNFSDGTGILITATDDAPNTEVDIVIAVTADVMLRTLADAKGDLIIASAADVFGRLAVGSAGQKLIADSGATFGIKWVDDWMCIEAYRSADPLATYVGAMRYYMEFDGTIVKHRITTEVAPVGTAILADVNLNGSTIYSTQSNRPTVATGGALTGVTTTFNTTNFSAGDYFTFDCDQVGTANRHLLQQLWVKAR